MERTTLETTAQSDQQVNILLVDDHPENLMALEAILGDLGQNLVRANSGLEALRCLLVQEFAVILLDVQMPVIDGFETAALIRERDKLQHTPIIFLTAMDKSETNIFRGYSVGAVDYIFKPFAPEVLKAKVGVFIDLFKKTEEIKRQAELLRTTNRELGKTNKAMGGLYKELEQKNLELRTERDSDGVVRHSINATAALETALPTRSQNSGRFTPGPMKQNAVWASAIKAAAVSVSLRADSSGLSLMPAPAPPA